MYSCCGGETRYHVRGDRFERDGVETIEAVGYDANGEGKSYDCGVVGVWRSSVGSVFEAAVGWSLFVFDIATRELQSEIEFSSSFTPTTLLASAHVHEQSSRRKSRVSYSYGTKKGKMIYEFKSIKDNAAIAALAQSPALDVIAAGDVEGNITVLNLKSDSIVVRFRHDKSHGAVTALSFRTQENGMPLLVSATASGSLLFFNLKKRLLHHTVDVAHEGGVITVSFYRISPYCFNGKGNSIKQWLLDSVDSTPRLLRFDALFHRNVSNSSAQMLRQRV